MEVILAVASGKGRLYGTIYPAGLDTATFVFLTRHRCLAAALSAVTTGAIPSSVARSVANWRDRAA